MKKLFFLHLFYFSLSLIKQGRSYLMAKNYLPPTNYISSSKANVFEKHAASVKSLKLEALMEIKISC